MRIKVEGEPIEVKEKDNKKLVEGKGDRKSRGGKKG